MPDKKESQNIEWKQTWHDEYLKWICGFANAQGGRIYLGKDDAGQIVGLKNSKKLLEELPNKIRDHLGLVPAINLLNENGKDYLEVVIDSSTVPISLRGSYYWRSGSVKQELKGQALTNFLLKKVGITWDRLVQERATLDDIDESAITRFKRDAAKAGRLPDLSQLSVEEILTKLRLLTREGVTNAALVLFGRDPGAFFSNLFVKIGRFGQSMVDMRFQEVCEGNLIQLLGNVMEMLEKKFLIKPVRFEGIHRIEELEYPAAALREILLNALVHRDYLGSMTQIKVFDYGISVWNAGQLPEELPIKKLFEPHESVPRNSLIAEVCYKVGYIDSWGRGVEKIMEACEQSGLPAPVIIERTGGIAVELFKPTAPAQVNPADDMQGNTSEEFRNDFGTISERFRNDFGMISERIQEKFGNEVLKAFEVICDHPDFTAEQIANTLGKTSRTAENYITKMKKAGFIKRKGAKLGGYWEIVR